MNFKQNVSRYAAGLVVVLALVLVGSQYTNIEKGLGYAGDKANALVAAVARSIERPPIIVNDGGGTNIVVQTSGNGSSNSGESSSNSGEEGNGLTYTLSVKKIGGGVVGEITGGTVTGSGINCGKTCSRKYKPHTFVTLTASTNITSRFVGWNVVGGTNICPDRTLPCSVSMESNVMVVATYAKLACSKMTPADATLLEKLGTVLSTRLTGSESQTAIIEQVMRNPNLSKDEKDRYVNQVRSSICLFYKFQ